MTSRPRLIALYLPQFHPVRENDEWWGAGFTEWTNAARARPLFRGHYQPHIPADLGFYDLRLAETREGQAELARRYGVESFCYYHYWFGGGRRMLQRPFQEVVASGRPDFGFCLCWANETWTGIWHGAPNRILMEQTYPGEEDHRAHFAALLPAFRDPRYTRVNGRPLFAVFKPKQIPNAAETLRLWRRMAEAAGLPGLHFVGVAPELDWDPAGDGFDAAIWTMPRIRGRPWISRREPLRWVRQRLEVWRGRPHIFRGEAMLDEALPPGMVGRLYPSIVHAWDNTPRSGRNGVVMVDSSPELYRRYLRKALDFVADNGLETRIVFLKSWNEWAEGNHLEPDRQDGHAYLKVLAEETGGHDKGSAAV